MSFLYARAIKHCDGSANARDGGRGAGAHVTSALAAAARRSLSSRGLAVAEQRLLVVSLLAFATVNGVLFNWILHLTVDLPTTLDTSAYVFFESYPSADSWKPMFRALEAVHETTRPLYQTIFFEETVKFQYPPTALLPLEVLRALSALEPRFLSFGLLNLVSWPALWVTIVLTGFIFTMSLSRYLGRPIGLATSDLVLLAIAIVILGLTFYPLVQAYRLGQIQTWINLLVAGMLLAWLAGRRALPGSLAGLCCLIKPQLALIFVWALIRKEWRFALGGLAVVVPVMGLSVAAYGVDNHLDYLRVLAFIGQHGESYFPNQSVNGLLNRLLFNGNNVVWQAHLFAPYHPLVHIGTLTTSALIIVLAMFWRHAEHAHASAIDLCIVLLTITMASPVAWEHHYGVLLPIFALVLPATLVVAEVGRYRIVIVIAAFALSSNVLLVTNELAASWLNLLQSHLFFAAVLLLVHLYRLRRAVAWRHRVGEAGASLAGFGARHA